MLGLTLADNFPQQRFQTLHIIMLEHPDMCSTDPYTKTNRGMVKLVGNDQTTFSNEGGNDGRISCETH